MCIRDRYIAGALPMSIMILVGFYRGIPREMEEAAYIDGCGIFKCFIQIIFPMVKPAIATASILDVYKRQYSFIYNIITEVWKSGFFHYRQ